MTRIADSELILNGDGSIYHLNLFPEDIADTVITVGDPDRVSTVSNYFDRIDVKKGKREFVSHTGYIDNKRITVISTGIGTDNIDIVLNELDALVNIDFETRTLKKEFKSLDIIRIGTTGSIQPEIQVDDFLMSEYAVGFDSLLHFYDSKHVQHEEIQQQIVKQTNWSAEKSVPYVVKYNEELGKKILSEKVHLGFTATNVGFYGPQSRKLRLDTQDPKLNDKLAAFKYNKLKITNLEMETAGIYGLSQLLGHRAVSMNCIVANRVSGSFSKNPEAATRNLIEYCLNKITEI